jgi:hypothetical protein
MSAPAAFAAAEAVRSGEWDDYLLALKQAIHDRERILQDEENVPPQTVTMQASGHQVWVWMQGPGKPHWEVRGTGAQL